MRMLVSVRELAEAREALRAGVDFIDLKEPSAGALGGLAVPVIRALVAALRAGEGAENAPCAEVGRSGDGVGGTWAATQADARRRAPMISATIGDLPPEALDAILARATAVGACGVDLVKVGVPGRGAASCALLATLAALPLAIVPVLIADDGLDAAVIDAACAPAFAAVMADTQAKCAGSLLELLGEDALAAFIDRAHAAGRMVGLAGALRLADLPQLAQLAPDFAGFRSAVCDGSREGRLDPGRLEALHAAIAMRASPLPLGPATVSAAVGAALAAKGPVKRAFAGKPAPTDSCSHGPGATDRLEALGAAVAMTPTAAPVQVRAADTLAT
jgi:uncharacterized protein (UPF0264 family)